MNERIKQLMDQAGIDVEAVENLGEMPAAIKFAELIVRECAHIAWANSTGYNISHTKIKEHFGVEE
jgi:hypothetical protein